ncbi:MAG: GAF domain-containing protein, partial [Actinomycetota bacterium]|nr:GAF domain-containing protein [Actinomycetota bacterium]
LIYTAHDKSSAVLEPLSRVTAARTDIFWRYAVPVASAGVRGVLSVDIKSDERPDAGMINRTVAWYRVALAASLVLHDAEAREQASCSLMSMTRELSEALEPGKVLETTLTHAMSLVGAATGSIMLLDPATSRLSIEVARGLPASVVTNTNVAIGEGIAGWVAATEQPLMVEDLEHSSARGQRHGVRTALSVPLADDVGIIGVLNVGSKARPARFTEHHRQTLAAFALHATTAWRTAHAMRTSQEINFETLKALALAMETKDPYAAGGTERVMSLSSQLGQALKLAPGEQTSLEIASMLHDIGMDLVLDGAGPGTRPLTTVERGMLAMHPSVAADILSQAPALRGVVPIVFHHHEHFDGNGYSGGLSGEGIPYGARILAVVDAFVAMTSDRPYRRALSTRQAIAELTEKAGTQFDPVVVEALV